MAYSWKDENDGNDCWGRGRGCNNKAMEKEIFNEKRAFFFHTSSSFVYAVGFLSVGLYFMLAFGHRLIFLPLNSFTTSWRIQFGMLAVSQIDFHLLFRTRIKRKICLQRLQQINRQYLSNGTCKPKRAEREREKWNNVKYKISDTNIRASRVDCNICALQCVMPTKHHHKYLLQFRRINRNLVCAPFKQKEIIGGANRLPDRCSFRRKILFLRSSFH